MMKHLIIMPSLIFQTISHRKYLIKISYYKKPWSVHRNFRNIDQCIKNIWSFPFQAISLEIMLNINSSHLIFSFVLLQEKKQIKERKKNVCNEATFSLQNVPKFCFGNSRWSKFRIFSDTR